MVGKSFKNILQQISGAKIWRSKPTYLSPEMHYFRDAEYQKFDFLLAFDKYFLIKMVYSHNIRLAKSLGVKNWNLLSFLL